MEKRMRPLLTMGLALALAGCGGGEEVANNSAAPTPTPTPGPMLGGVDLDKPIRATGSAPYWAIYIAPGTIAFADAPAASPTDFYPISPKLEGDTARFETQTPDAEAVTITLIAKACTAGKETLPLGAEVRIGSRTLKGCAGPGAYDWAARKPSPSPTPSPAKAK
ncbi:hypothetical protein [Sphingomonas sp. Root241]|uniref:hypothetical protein n=1 Tax=Sphingomonas sp. Root241 TaxID=1736501 RepID=UPI0006F27B08|nr:hypothetical protein [Sphingomonas sp. Root241]KRC82647.1 hypothetical protein ASE13_10405 [Sphingomonas sp. Root241]